MLKKILIINYLLLSLVGCNNESNTNNMNNSVSSSIKHINIETSDVQLKTFKNDLTLINTMVTSEVDADLIISELVQLNKNSGCKVNGINNLNLTLSSDEIGECRYEYTVSPKREDLYDGESHSIVRMSVSETSQENTLTAINKNTDLGTEVIVDLEAELSAELSGSGYHVVDDVTIVGSGSAYVDVINNTITYTPELIDISEILYSMSDGENILLGSIFISISDTENTPPIVENYVKEGIISKGTMIEVDLSNVILDEEDRVTLDSVKTYNANVSITSSTEHTFTFESETPGGHEVTYTVSDGRGGYAVAQAYIEVDVDFSLIQDWEDITVYDPYIDNNINFTAPMSKAFAEYTNTNYSKTIIEDGISGPENSEVVTMTYNMAETYCKSRGGRLPLLRELELIAGGNVFETDNWPASEAFWTTSKDSISSAHTLNLITGSESISNADIYTTCVMITTGVNDFKIMSFTERDSTEVNDRFDTTRYLDTVVVDPDDNVAPYYPVTFEVIDGHGGFGITNNRTHKVNHTNESGVATIIYEFTSDYTDKVIAYVNEFSADVVKVDLSRAGFDPTNPNDWEVAKIYGSKSIEEYTPIIDSNGTKFSLGDTSQYVTSISKSLLIGNDVTVIFGVDRSNATTLVSGNSNIILQQVSSKAPDINSNIPCDEEVYGDCRWSLNEKDTAGFPQNDNRWIGFLFDYYSKAIKLQDNTGVLASAPLTNGGKLTQLYYKIMIRSDSIYIYQNESSDFTGISPTMTYQIDVFNFDLNKFYYFGMSGGAHGNGGVRGTISYLDILFN